VSGQGFVPALCALNLSLSGTGCGDIGDVQVPLVPQRRAAPSPAPLPTFVRAGAPQVVMSVDIGAGATGACAIEYSFLLPPSTARSTLQSQTGEGDRLVHGDRALVQCGVAPRVASAEVFDVNLWVDYESRTFVAVRGTFEGEGDSSQVALQVTLPDRSVLEADCTSEVVQVSPSAAWFRTASCWGRSPHAGLRECSVEASAILENCER
jgi:hypothetical protein